MKVFYDTNIILEFLFNRKEGELEDSYQYQTAVNAGCNVLLTLNIRDFKQITDSSISIMTPEEFVNKYIH